MNIDHFAAGGDSASLTPLNPTLNPKYAAVCLFHLSCASKNELTDKRERKERGLTAAPSYTACCRILKRENIVIETWKKKKMVYGQKSTLMKKDSLTVQILRPFLLP